VVHRHGNNQKLRARIDEEMKVKTKHMKVKTLAVILSSAVLTVSSGMAQQLGINFTGGGIGSYYNGSPLTLGYEFQVTSPVTITGLAAYDPNAPGGIPFDVPVGLWYNGGGLIDSATVLTGTPAIPGSQFAEVGITPISLAPGLYQVGAYDTQAFTFGGGGEGPPFTGVTFAPGINYVEDSYIYTGGLSYPSSDQFGGGDGFYGWFGGNIVVGGSNASVPDASSSLMLLSGACVALGAARRKLACI
jgi:hypothetical protein